MDLKNQILIALGLDSKIKLEWQSKSEDGTIFVSTADELATGVDISVLTEDGTTILLPIGSYTTEDGVTFRVEEEGVVAEVLESETEEVENEEEVVEEEELKEDDDYADVGDWEGMEKRIQNLEDAVASLKADKDGGDMEDEEEKEEELSAPRTTPRKTKTTIVDEFAKMKKENKRLKTELAKTPAAAPLNTNKFSTENKVATKKQIQKMSKQERYLYNLYN
jgi:hypothetical protein